jgi:hypothetical protein
MMAATSDGLAAELERLRPDSEDSALVAGRKMYCRAAFVDKHFDTIRAALSASAAEAEALRGALERIAALPKNYVGAQYKVAVIDIVGPALRALTSPDGGPLAGDVA